MSFWSKVSEQASERLKQGREQLSATIQRQAAARASPLAQGHFPSCSRALASAARAKMHLSYASRMMYGTRCADSSASKQCSLQALTAVKRESNIISSQCANILAKLTLEDSQGNAPIKISLPTSISFYRCPAGCRDERQWGSSSRCLHSDRH